jgi:hypothetical protein
MQLHDLHRLVKHPIYCDNRISINNKQQQQAIVIIIVVTEIRVLLQRSNGAVGDRGRLHVLIHLRVSIGEGGGGGGERRRGSRHNV